MSLPIFKYLPALFAPLIFCETAFAQVDTVYLRFDRDSKEVYLKENGVGDTVKASLYYATAEQDCGREFYINGLLFRHDSSRMLKKRVAEESADYPEKILSANEVVQLISNLQDRYPFGSKPSEDYPYLFIVFQQAAGSPSILYEVKWQYYIE